MIPNSYVLKPYKDAKLKTLANWLKEHRVNANLITAVGLCLGLGAAAGILTGQIWLGLGLLGLSVMADLLDGTLARLSPPGQFSGKLLDAGSDRAVELAWIGALIVTGRLNLWALTLGLGSVLLLFCRCLAYWRGVDSSVVICTRFGRMTALIAVVVLPWRAAASWLYYLVTAGTLISSLQILSAIFSVKPAFHKNKAVNPD